jgi:hypothetical protein
VDATTVQAVQSLLDVVAELERLRGAAGINTREPIWVEFRADRWAVLRGERWLAALTPLRLELGGLPATGVQWTIPSAAGPVRVSLPARYASRLASEAVRLNRREMAAERRLRLRLRQFESCPNGDQDARVELLAQRLDQTSARLQVLRQNAAEAGRRAAPVELPGV